ncbi:MULTISPECIES: sensor histidine kinase [Chryseobacterium]|uniref:histidine kinase n=1 Tax=Chryseobacterium indoltheticum TaxID=254 RepID=A0A381FI93_9FLAO|nr:MULTISPECIES: ATP-binding protein [Chryseobacterium]AZA61016.1 GHKL domain-containing protein [Chryseobacterium indoltheticum]AZA73332.1 GHKL domain-containing protein [Chryseobacterium indoltheticum]MDQ8142625.1 ATP-binding protein [Chryseobacterium sp. CFS15]QQQ30067.1 GHKL domain-containing protein [Chryseobacterium indoltheticum]SIR30767.1 two-component system, OmpR family, phosphate regulon sensor histidine kinase PhoR [Chryseobacterium indoltheticum]
MKFYRLTLVSSCLLTLVMFVLVIIFDSLKDIYYNTSQFKIGLFLCVVLMFIINYVVLELLFNYYAKKQVRKISKILPEEIIYSDQNNITLKELGERFSDFNQQQLTEMDMMKEMESYRKEYIGNVSHELKTPLFSIQGYVETLVDGGVDNLTIRDKYLERIGISVERLIAIVNDLDMINRLEAGEINLTVSRFDVNILIKEIFDLLDLEAEKNNTVLQLQTLHSQIFVEADKQKVSQVFINLISNAIHYANRQEAKVVVKTSVLRNKVLIEVIDNGMGIKAELLPRIFERFYRVETSRSRRQGGSGLGLAIVKHILEAHNENITVESVYLEGTKFSFMLEKSK